MIHLLTLLCWVWIYLDILLRSSLPWQIWSENGIHIGHGLVLMTILLKLIILCLGMANLLIILCWAWNYILERLLWIDPHFWRFLNGDAPLFLVRKNYFYRKRFGLWMSTLVDLLYKQEGLSIHTKQYSLQRHVDSHLKNNCLSRLLLKTHHK